MMSRAVIGSDQIGQGAAQSQCGETVQAPGVGRDLADGLHEGGHCSRLMKLPPMMPKINIMAEPVLPTCAGVRAKAVINMPQPVAPKTAARIKTMIPERVTPFHLEEQ